MMLCFDNHTPFCTQICLTLTHLSNRGAPRPRLTSQKQQQVQSLCSYGHPLRLKKKKKKIYSADEHKTLNEINTSQAHYM